MALYPPVIESSMPAFDIDANQNGSVKIYFKLSDYNTVSEIQQIHLTVSYQVNNVNALSSSGPINNIYLYNVEGNIPYQLKDGVILYYISINSSMLKDGWKRDTLYKVQLRFSEEIISKVPELTSKLSKFSQWSTVCLIKPIYPPYINITNINGTSINTQFADFVMTYSVVNPIDTNKVSSQILDRWKIDLLSGNTLLSSSDWQQVGVYNYTKGTDVINLSCSLPYQFERGAEYAVQFSIKTKGGYEKTETYSCTFSGWDGDGIQGSLKIYTNEEQGYIKVVLDTSADSNTDKMVLRRANSMSNFSTWEDLRIYSSIADFTYYDFTVESGVAYRYLVQKMDTRGSRGQPLYDQVTSKGLATIIESEHAFLLQSAGLGELADVKQLKLKFDLQLSSFNINISESRTDTLGSQYPFIRRNGNMYYRSFPISGTISTTMDDNELFIDKNSLNNGYTSIYDNYRYNINYYTNQYDFTFERKFREKVEQFLYNIKPKLYKSMQEGNILIKLMEVSLTPKQQLNRLIYTFSATAYEIDSPTVENLIKYNILKKGGN